jgi:hypothetical protein
MAKHHDNHGKDASVPGKGAPVPKEHWEKLYSPRAVKDTDHIIGAQYEPMQSKKRTKTYVPVNPEDH